MVGPAIGHPWAPQHQHHRVTLSGTSDFGWSPAAVRVPAARQTVAILRYLASQAGPVPAASLSREPRLPRSTTCHLLGTRGTRGSSCTFPGAPVRAGRDLVRPGQRLHPAGSVAAPGARRWPRWSIAPATVRGLSLIHISEPTRR